ncbi:MAG: hypothetical protein ANABAC_2134 [Anaerolineae bacterium]|nr:MAG: hypothetical protein ANABAC_2134 [Anaerolineae bacterium]
MGWVSPPSNNHIRPIIGGPYLFRVQARQSLPLSGSCRANGYW